MFEKLNICTSKNNDSGDTTTNNDTNIGGSDGKNHNASITLSGPTKSKDEGTITTTPTPSGAIITEKIEQVVKK